MKAATDRGRESINTPSRTSSPEDGYEDLAVVVLAAGAGRRIRSKFPKWLQTVAGRPMIWHVLQAAASANPRSTVIVVGPGMLQAIEQFEDDITVAVQANPRGTGDAVRAALPLIGDAKWLLVLFADQPLLTGSLVKDLVVRARDSRALVTLLSCQLDDAMSYGRIARDAKDRPLGIVERADDDPSKRVGRVEISSGNMVLQMPWAAGALQELVPMPQNGEHILTNIVETAIRDGATGTDWPVATMVSDLWSVSGVNDRVELAQADAFLRERIRRMHMLNGVTLVGPDTIFIDVDVEIGQDTTILPHSIIGTGCRIGAGCRIGPYAHLIEARIGDNEWVGPTHESAAIVVKASEMSASLSAVSDKDPNSDDSNEKPVLDENRRGRLKSAPASSRRRREAQEIVDTPTNSPRRLRAFLCHASGDKPTVRTLYRRLRRDGFEPWLDERDLIAGQDWQAEIVRAVRGTDVVIVCLSQASVTKAGYVQSEIKHALDVADQQPEGTIFVIPVRLEECAVPDRLRRWQWVDYFDEKGYQQLRRALRQRISGLAS